MLKTMFFQFIGMGEVITRRRNDLDVLICSCNNHVMHVEFTTSSKAKYLSPVQSLKSISELISQDELVIKKLSFY
jgi:hypothetical protein